MTRHLLKLMWNRKRQSALVTVEIFCSFLVLFAVVALGAFYADNYRQPLGFADRDLLAVNITGRLGADGTALEAENVRQIAAEARRLPEVAAAAIAFPLPFSSSFMEDEYRKDGREVVYGLSTAATSSGTSPGSRSWPGAGFSPEDDGRADAPVVITERLAKEAFGALDPLGQDLGGDPRPGRKEPAVLRVVGVVREFRQDGEYAAAQGHAFRRGRLDDAMARDVRPCWCGCSRALRPRSRRPWPAGCRRWRATRRSGWSHSPRCTRRRTAFASSPSSWPRWSRRSS
jgi:putative ABC transport system permease protein